MKRLMPILLAGSLLVGCQTIPSVDRGVPRHELEVEVQLDPLVGALLQQDADLGEFDAVVSDAVFELADVGLRFYPVASPAYGANHARPEYLLTVRIQGLDAHRPAGLLRGHSEAKAEEASFQRLGCVAVATVMKRRGAGPPLMVGKTVGHGEAKVQEASAALSSQREFALRADGIYGQTRRVSADDLTACVRDAVHSALSQLIEPIDREFYSPPPK